MKIKSFHFSRFRAFREEAQMQLAPLTVIIGPNGGGKSVLSRFPLLLASGLDERAEAPLDLEAGGVRHASRFEDLIFQRSSQPFSLGAGFELDGHLYRFTTTLRHISEKHVLGIEEFHLFQDGETLISMVADAPEDITRPNGSFRLAGTLASSQPVGIVSFIGLFPYQVEGLPDTSQELTRLRRLFEAAFESPSYLGPFRSEQGSLPRIPKQGSKSLGPRGEHALDILGDDRLRKSGELTTKVEAWFEESMTGNRIEMKLADELPRLMVHDPLRGLAVDIHETGAGFAQVLPVAVQAFAKQSGLIDSSLVIVEQPELHLHPAVHGHVMDLLIDTVQLDPDNTRYVCETHSEQMITRLRRRIAEGKISAQSVTVLSVWHKSSIEDEVEPIRVITFDEFGNPDSWPVGVFEEAFSDLMHLREAGLQRLAGDAGQPKGASA